MYSNASSVYLVSTLTFSVFFIVGDVISFNVVHISVNAYRYSSQYYFVTKFCKTFVGFDALTAVVTKSPMVCNITP
jgi:hypothetical protein